jgi:hypothetical protein
VSRPQLAYLLDLPPTVDVRRAASLLGCSADALYDAINAGESPVPTLRVGRRVLIPVPGLLIALGASVDVLEALRRTFETTRAGPPDPAAATDAADPSPKGNDRCKR